MIDKVRLLLTVLAIGGMTTGTWALIGGGYDLTWNTIDGGGTTSAGGTYTLAGTIGQPDASGVSALAGGNYTLTGGFWSATILSCASFAPADFNHDCSVDVNDFLLFKACGTGSHLPYNPAALPPGCTLTVDGQGHIAADFNGDGFVDLNDFGTFQRCYSGPGNPANPNCAN